MNLWWLTKDGDTDCLALYERHYSCYRYADGRQRTQFVGPGEKVVLRTIAGDALFVWRNFIDDSGQEGINCAVFRNESEHRSSDLVRQADAIADCLWPDRRHYTYVRAEAIRSSNPGYCFQRAGWQRCGRTKGGLIVLERQPLPAAARQDSSAPTATGDPLPPACPTADPISTGEHAPLPTFPTAAQPAGEAKACS